MLSDKKYGLSVNVMATRVMPSLLPQTVNPSLNLEQFTLLLEVSLLDSVFMQFTHEIFVTGASRNVRLYRSSATQ